MSQEITTWWARLTTLLIVGPFCDSLKLDAAATFFGFGRRQNPLADQHTLSQDMHFMFDTFMPKLLNVNLFGI